MQEVITAQSEGKIDEGEEEREERLSHKLSL